MFRFLFAFLFGAILGGLIMPAGLRARLSELAVPVVTERLEQMPDG